jgi:hypothetical protein
LYIYSNKQKGIKQKSSLELGADLMPVILATQEEEIRRIMVPSQPRQIAHETLSRKNFTKKGW